MFRPSLHSNPAPLDPLKNRPRGALAPSARLASASVLVFYLLPVLSFAQASPFETGATAIQDNLLTIMTPVAIILVIFLGVMAMVGRIAWGWVVGAIAGIAIAFGAPQIVTWVRGMFGV